jgi:hypothetical protein
MRESIAEAASLRAVEKRAAFAKYSRMKEIW